MLLPEWGMFLASLHARQSSLFRVTVDRATGGPLLNPQFDLRNSCVATYRWMAFWCSRGTGDQGLASG
jgi:hypothetical protein